MMLNEITQPNKNMVICPRLFQMNIQMILSLFPLIEYWQIVDPQWMFLNFPGKHLFRY